MQGRGEPTATLFKQFKLQAKLHQEEAAEEAGQKQDLQQLEEENTCRKKVRVQ